MEAEKCGLIDLDDDSLLCILQKLPVRLTRGPMLVVSQRMKTLASSSVALGLKVNVAFLAKSCKQKAITPILHALAELNKDGKITDVTLGNHNWGSTSTKRLFKLFPALEVIDFGACKKVAHHHALTDWNLPAVPQLRSFTWGWCFDYVTTRALVNLVHGREALECLVLGNVEGMGEQGCSGVSDEFLEELGRSCPALKTLSIQGDLRFTDRGVLALLDGCKELKKLVLKKSTIFHQRVSHVSLVEGSTCQALIDRGFSLDKVLPNGVPHYV